MTMGAARNESGGDAEDYLERGAVYTGSYQILVGCGIDSSGDTDGTTRSWNQLDRSGD